MASYKVLNGETSNGLTLNDKDTMCVYNGGAANKTTVNSGGTMTVLAGATATEILENGGYVTIGESGPNVTFKKNTFKNLVLENNITTVHSGTTATNITVNYDARLYVSSGGIANNITVNYYGCLDIWAGGSASGVTITKAGLLALYEYNGGGGVATDVTVGAGGHLNVMSGTTATNVMLSGGEMTVYNGGTATIAFSPLMKGVITWDPGAVVTILDPEAKVYYVNETSVISSADTMTDLNIVSGESAYVYDGGTLNNTTINANGKIEVSSGGVANITTVNNLAALFISSGGIADKATVNGICAVCSSGVANSAMVNSGGTMYVSSNGVANSATVNSGGIMIVSSAGTVDKTTVSSSGYMELSGTANSTTVNGDVIIYSGGTMNNTTIDFWGDIYIKNGGTANKTTINYGGGLYVSSGGFASNTTLVSPDFLTYAKNQMWVAYGGSADRVMIQSTGALYLDGSATNIIAEDGAYLVFTVFSDTYAKGTSNGIAFENKNGYISGYTIDHGYLSVRYGGKAVKTTVNEMCFVDYFGVASNTTVNANGRLFVSRGGLVESTTVKSDGRLFVNSGGTANSMTVSSGGELRFGADGGALTGRMTFEAGAVVSAEDEAVIDFDLTHTSPTSAALLNNLAAVQGAVKYTLTVNGTQSNGAYKLSEGASGFGSKTEITVRNPVGTDIGVLTVDSKSNTFSYGGRKYTLQLNDESLFVTVVAESGSDNIFTGDVTGTQKDITSGISALGVNVNAGGILNVQSDGKAINTMVNQGGIFMAIGAGKIKGLTVNQGGVAYIGSDTTAESFVINGGEGHIESDGWAFGMSKGNTVASNTIVKNGGMLFVSAGGHVEGLRASEGGHVIAEGGDVLGARFFSATLDAMNGANVSSVTLLDGGEMNVFAGGSAQSVHVGEGGVLAVESGGEVNNINVSAGGILTGVVYGANIVNVYGGTIDFDISGFTPDNAPAYLFAETTLESDEEFPCTLTVGDEQAYGTYGLLDNAYVFKGAITVRNTSGEALGELAAGSTVNIDGVDYTLNVSGYPDYHMTVTIADNAAPTITNISADITAPTNKNVTVTAEFADNVKLASAQYRIGDSAWTDYAGGVVVTGNATVYFKATDAAGNSTEAQYEVANIDKNAPTVTNIAADITAPTNQNVFVTADFEDAAGIAIGQYRIGGGAWTDYAGGVVVTENATVYFKATDMAGNESSGNDSFTVSNIDKVAPTISKVKPDTTAPAETVTVTASFADNVALASKQYRIGMGAWTDYTTGVTVTENTTVYFKAVDTAGNEASSSYEVTNIQAPVVATNAPDDGRNDFLWTKKEGWNDENIPLFETNTVAGQGEIRLDVAGTVDKDEYHNLFGHDEFNTDTGDVAKIDVAKAAKLTFEILSTAAGTFYVYEDGFDKKGDRKMLTVGKVSVKANTPALLKDVCLTAGEGKYYVAMTAKNVKKEGTEGLYNVNVVESKFFVDADAGSKKNDTADEGKTISIGRGKSKSIVLDKAAMTGSTEFKNFVGFTDGADWAKLDLASSAYLSFHVSGEGDGKAKFTVWKEDANGKLSKVANVSLPVKKTYDTATKAQFLDTSKYTYYVSMECTDAAKGRSLYYNVEVADGAVFFDSADDGRNDVLYDKKAKAFYREDDDHHFVSTKLGLGTKGVRLDSASVGDPDYDNFVGYEDAADYAKISLTSGGILSFTIEATGDATFTLYRKGEKRGFETLEAIQSVKLAVAKGETTVAQTMDVSTELEAGEYYVSMEAKNTKANDKGSVFYNVTAHLGAAIQADALSMPMAATAYADSVQDRLPGESVGGLLASL